MAFDYVNARIYLPEYYRKSEILLTRERVLSYKSDAPPRIFVPFKDLFGIEANTVPVNPLILNDDWSWAVVQRTRELVHKDLEGCEDALNRANILVQQGRLAKASLYYTKERDFQVSDNSILNHGTGSLFDRVYQLNGVNKAWLKEQYASLPEIAGFIRQDPCQVSGDDLKTALERAVTIWELGEKIEQDGI